MSLLQRVRGRGNAQASTEEVPEISLPPIDSLAVRLSALSLVTKTASGVSAQLTPLIGRDRNARLVDLSDKTVVVSVRDTVRALPVFEVIAEWQMSLCFVDRVSKEEVILPYNWQWIVRHIDPYTAEIVAQLTLRGGFAPVILPTS